MGNGSEFYSDTSASYVNLFGQEEARLLGLFVSICRNEPSAIEMLFSVYYNLCRGQEITYEYYKFNSREGKDFQPVTAPVFFRRKSPSPGKSPVRVSYLDLLFSHSHQPTQQDFFGHAKYLMRTIELGLGVSQFSEENITSLLKLVERLQAHGYLPYSQITAEDRQSQLKHLKAHLCLNVTPSLQIRGWLETVKIAHERKALLFKVSSEDLTQLEKFIAKEQLNIRVLELLYLSDIFNKGHISCTLERGDEVWLEPSMQDRNVFVAFISDFFQKFERSAKRFPQPLQQLIVFHSIHCRVSEIVEKRQAPGFLKQVFGGSLRQLNSDALEKEYERLKALKFELASYKPASQLHLWLKDSQSKPSIEVTEHHMLLERVYAFLALVSAYLCKEKENRAHELAWSAFKKPPLPSSQGTGVFFSRPLLQQEVEAKFGLSSSPPNHVLMTQQSGSSGHSDRKQFGHS